MKKESSTLKTPYYVIHKNILDDNFKELKKACERYWGNYIIGYSYKTNALPWLVSHFDNLGCYAEVVSEDEYNLAKMCIKDKTKVIYNGPIKTKETFIEALTKGCYVNIDSQKEIEWLDGLKLEDCNIGVRVNFDIEKLCPGQSQCLDEGGRFGFCYENGEFFKAMQAIKEKGVKVKGLHLHTSSKTRGIDIYHAICNIACEVVDKYNLELEFLDIGGGFFGGLPTKPSFEEYFEKMSSILKKSFDFTKVKIIIEPGMALIGAPVDYVTTVIDVKDTTYDRFVVTDGSRTNIDPLMTKTVYFNEYERGENTVTVDRQVICGYTCMEHDRLYVAKDELELNVNDRIIYKKVGAYTMCLTPLFIKYFPDVYVKDNDNYMLVRKAWTPEQYMQNSILDV